MGSGRFGSLRCRSLCAVLHAGGAALHDAGHEGHVGAHQAVVGADQLPGAAVQAPLLRAAAAQRVPSRPVPSRPFPAARRCSPARAPLTSRRDSNR